MHWYGAPVAVQPALVAVCANRWFGVEAAGNEGHQLSKTANSSASAIWRLGFQVGECKIQVSTHRDGTDSMDMNHIHGSFTLNQKYVGSMDLDR